ncbi:hypothetical protein [Thermodesulfitimonas autotrophica]|uniref:hypothetical protein n=1 Tax=Thermodesulfitimonas autotrophica TaxID=1894989 RepID=UPI002FDF2A08
MKETLWRHLFLFLLISGLLLFIVTAFSGGISDPDTWWHLAAGKYIVQTRSVPHADPFSWTVAGKPWVTHEWLAEVLLYLAYAAGQFWGVLSFLLAVASVLFLLYWRLLTTAKGPFFVAALVLLITGEMLYPFLELRPQVFSYVLCVAFLYLLHCYEQGKNRLFLLPLLTALWANNHGSFFLGPALLLLYTCCGLVPLRHEKLVNRRLDKMALARLLLVLALCVAAAALTPNGGKLLVYPFSTIGASEMMDNIQEWLSPDFHNPYNQLFLVYYLGTFLLLLLTPQRIRLFDLVLFLLCGAAAFTHARFIAYALLVNGLLWANYYRPALRWKTQLKGAVKYALLPALLALYAVILAGRMPPQDPVDYRFADPQEYPVKALAYLKEHPLKGKMLNYYGWGGYLIWNRAGEKVFIDGRADVYLPKVFDDYRRITHLAPEAPALLEAYGIDYVFMPAAAALVQALRFSPDWETYYADQTAVILVKKKGGASRAR